LRAPGALLQKDRILWKVTAAGEALVIDNHLVDPAEILQLGPDHSSSLACLQTNLGTTRPLRHVQRLSNKLVAAKRKTARCQIEFWPADWTPWAALAAIRKAWRYLHAVMGQAGLSGAQASAKGLRHGFGVAAVSAGISLNLVQKWLGRASLTTTAIYANAVGAEEKDFAKRMWV
jgi:integrase